MHIIVVFITVIWCSFLEESTPHAILKLKSEDANIAEQNLKLAQIARTEIADLLESKLKMLQDIFLQDSDHKTMQERLMNEIAKQCISKGIDKPIADNAESPVTDEHADLESGVFLRMLIDSINNKVEDGSRIRSPSRLKYDSMYLALYHWYTELLSWITGFVVYTNNIFELYDKKVIPLPSKDHLLAIKKFQSSSICIKNDYIIKTIRMANAHLGALLNRLNVGSFNAHSLESQILLPFDNGQVYSIECILKLKQQLASLLSQFKHYYDLCKRLVRNINTLDKSITKACANTRPYSIASELQ